MMAHKIPATGNTTQPGCQRLPQKPNKRYRAVANSIMMPETSREVLLRSGSG